MDGAGLHEFCSIFQARFLFFSKGHLWLACQYCLPQIDSPVVWATLRPNRKGLGIAVCLGKSSAIACAYASTRPLCDYKPRCPLTDVYGCSHSFAMLSWSLPSPRSLAVAFSPHNEAMLILTSAVLRCKPQADPTPTGGFERFSAQGATSEVLFKKKMLIWSIRAQGRGNK